VYDQKPDPLCAESFKKANTKKLMKKVVVIGSGFAGLSAACFMAKAGWHVTVLEKNEQPGGRARQLKAHGFTFDMGPSWYWMPDVFEKFFASFGKRVTDYYHLRRLDPSYRVYGRDQSINVPANFEELKSLFESLEPGSSKQLEKFLAEAEYKYAVAMQRLVYQPGLSVTELLDWSVISQVGKLDLFSSMKTHVAKYFKHPLLQQLMEFPGLFLGAMPSRLPALYSLMNYADSIGGTWYPLGGMYKIVEAMYELAQSLNVAFRFNEPVTSINIVSGSARSVTTAKRVYDADVVIGAADYHHIETKLLDAKYRSYSPAYWGNRTMAPGCLLYYVGLNKRIPNLSHHTLFFDSDFKQHSEEIYNDRRWPSKPLFYMCAPSVTDNSVAPAGCENLFLLIPVAAGLSNDSTEIREKYFESIINRVEQKLDVQIKNSIVYKRSYAYSDFSNDYNSFKGNAYGLANTLMQTAVLKPKCRSKKVKNLFYTGQLTVPGPGVPPSLVSGEVVATQILKQFAVKRYDEHSII
jgi:phytoene desaturase